VELFDSCSRSGFSVAATSNRAACSGFFVEVVHLLHLQPELASPLSEGPLGASPPWPTLYGGVLRQAPKRTSVPHWQEPRRRWAANKCALPRKAVEQPRERSLGSQLARIGFRAGSGTLARPVEREPLRERDTGFPGQERSGRTSGKSESAKVVDSQRGGARSRLPRTGGSRTGHEAVSAGRTSRRRWLTPNAVVVEAAPPRTGKRSRTGGGYS
jgi:hypothetical protein